LIVTIAVYSLVSFLLAWALVRKPQTLTVVLALAFVAAVFAAQHIRGDALRSILMGIDGFAIIISWLLWKVYHSSRAALVAVIGMLKVSFGIAAAAADLNGLLWASGNNALFVVQVLIAGGFANGFMAWLGRSHDGARTRSGRVLGYMERLP
jgi:hypothetical protein